MIIVSAQSANAVPKEFEKVCSSLEKRFKKQNMLLIDDLRGYCAGGCEFIPEYDCSFLQAERTSGGKGSLEALVENVAGIFKSLMDNEKVVDVKDEDLDFTPVDYLIQNQVFEGAAGYFMPWLCAVVPCIFAAIFNVRDNVKRRAWIFLLNFAFWIIHFVMYVEQDPFSVIFVFLLSYQSAFSVITQRFMYDSIAIVFVIVAVGIFGILVENKYAHFFFGLVCVVIFCILFYRKLVSSKKEELLSVFGLVLAFKMCAGYVSFMLSQFGVTNSGLNLLKLFVMSSFPLACTRSTFLANARLQSLVVSKTFDDDVNPVLMFFICFMAYILIFIFVRMFLGISVLRSVRMDLSPSTLMCGFYAYFVDVVNPFVVLITAVVHRDPRRLLYSLTMVTYNIGEFLYAKDVFFLRIFIMVVDWLVLDTGLVDAQRFLDYDIQLDGFVFEKPGAFPYACIDTLASIRQSVRVLHAEVHDATGEPIQTCRGVGLVRDTSKGKMLFSVRHVLSQKNRIYTPELDLDQDVTHILTVGESIDPPVQMDLLRCTARGTSVRNVSKNEITKIKYLVMISPGGAVCPITDFSIDRFRGDISASINLRSGDSGSPIVGVLDDGTCVLVGAVSRGNAQEGALNLISMIGFKEELSGSPGHTSEGYLDVDHAAPLNDKILRNLNVIISENRLALMELAMSYDTVLPHLADVSGLDWKERFDADPDDRGDYNDDQWKKKGKARQKSVRKDKAMRKRGFMMMLDGLFLDDVSRAIVEDCYDNNEIIKFNRLRRKNVGNWVS